MSRGRRKTGVGILRNIRLYDSSSPRETGPVPTVAGRLVVVKLPENEWLASVKLHPNLGHQKPAAILLDHVALFVQHDAMVEVGSVTVPEGFAEPDIFPIRFLVVLTNPPLNCLQFGRFGNVLESIGYARPQAQ